MRKNPLQQLAYLSAATMEPSKADLQAILELAVKQNQASNISGFLMYAEQCFFQVIEGPKLEIDALYSNLLSDTRHHCVTRILYNEVDHRRFSNWSMAFIQYDKADDVSIKGYSTYLHDFMASAKNNLNFVDNADTEMIEGVIEGVRRNLMGI
jgi:hypothetical protein